MDKLFINGKIYTMEHETEFFEAMGIKNGKIEFLGNNKDTKNIKASEIIDLKGKTVIPGMSDSHMHMYAYCQNKQFVNLQNVKNLKQLFDELRKKAESTKEGEWIKGVNFDQSKLEENRFPTRQELDEVSSKHPVLIKRVCLHNVIANSLALQLAGIDKNFDAGNGGVVEKDSKGELNGIVREQTTKVFDEIMPDLLNNEEVKKEIFSEVLQDMSSKGITCIHTYAAKIWKYIEDIDFYKKLEKDGELPLRVNVYFDELFEPEYMSQDEIENPEKRVYKCGYKLFTDGSLGSRSAALFEEYEDDKGNKGVMICTKEELKEKIMKAHEKGLQAAIHAIGDRALDTTISAIEDVLEKVKKEKNSENLINKMKPFRIIHAQMVDDGLVERMRKLPLVIDIQPIFLCTDKYWIEDRIGTKRLKGSYAWKTMMKNGLIQTGGSDSPVETYEPLKGMFAAVARCSIENPEEEPFNKSECLSNFEALSLYTKNPPYATNQQNEMGTLTLGKFADIVVLDKDIMKINASEILETRVLQTYVGGNKVFDIKESKDSNSVL